MNSDQVNWIAVDWGTTNLRCWAMSAQNDVLASARSDQGMGVIAAGEHDFESALLDLIGSWLKGHRTTPVYACGMVGAKQGWIEAPYDLAPCPPRTSLIQAPTRDKSIDVFIHSGICQSSPADVMRGEETQIAGLLAIDPGYEGLVCLPGTHSKWVTVTEGGIESFRTYITGELWSLLAEHSVLQHTTSSEGWCESAFLDAFQLSLNRPEEILAQCFGLRAEALLNGLGGVESRSRLSGLLLGVEIAGALNGLRSTRQITLIGSHTSASMYRSALETLNISMSHVEVEKVTLAGLAASRAVE